MRGAGDNSQNLLGMSLRMMVAEALPDMTMTVPLLMANEKVSPAAETAVVSAVISVEYTTVPLIM